MDGKWSGLGGMSYRLEDLGRPAVFLLPEEKLGIVIGDKTIRQIIEDFLVSHFGGFTTYTSTSYGVWRDGEQVIAYDNCVLFRVSFEGKDRIPAFAAKLAEIALLIDEKCIYFEAGQYASLLFPTPPH